MCDSVHREPVTGKLTILGTFGTLAVSEFPAVIPEICIYAALSAWTGPVSLNFKVVDVDQEETVLVDQFQNVNFVGRLETAEVVEFLKEVRFPNEGEYWFQLYAGNHFIAERKVIVGRPTLED